MTPETKLDETRAADGMHFIVAGLRALRKHWPIVVACVLLGSGISLVYSKSIPRTYQASAMVELNPNPPRPLSDKVDTVLTVGGDYFDNREYFETQLKIITSSKVLLAAARASGLASDASFFGLKGPARTFTDEQAAGRLAAAVRVEPVRNSRLLTIHVTDEVPERAKRLCEAVTNAYIEQNLEKAISASSDAVVWLAGQVQTVKKELERDENSLHEFKQTNDLPSTSINDSSNMVRQEMQDLTSALTKTRTRRGELAARLSELSTVGADNPDALPATELLSNTYLQELRQAYQVSARTLKGLIAEGRAENHPAVRSAQTSFDDARAALLREIGNLKGALERDLSAIKRQEGSEQALYDSAHRRAVDLTMKEIQYHRLDRTRDQNERLFAMLQQHMKEADLARMMRINNIHVIEPPGLPGAPISPRTRLNVVFGTLVGLLLGVAVAWGRESLDNTLKTPEDVEQKLGVTFLGLLPVSLDDFPNKKRPKRKRLERANDPSAAPELVVHHRPLSGIAEAARSVRTNLMFTSPDRPFRKLLVTSAAPSEGKTTVACSLAIAFAQGGQRVCIVDCDLRRPRMHRIFGRGGDLGVTNVLMGELTAPEAATKTVVDNLWCIPSGPIPPNPADLLHSERFAAFIDDLGKHFDRVVIDSPPLVAVTDAAIISRLVDGTVFVSRAFATTASTSRQGLRALRDVDAPIAGAVLNAVDVTRHEYAYYYYYRREGYGPRPDEGPGSDDQHGPTNEPGDRAAAN